MEFEGFFQRGLFKDLSIVLVFDSERFTGEMN